MYAIAVSNGERVRDGWKYTFSKVFSAPRKSTLANMIVDSFPEWKDREILVMPSKPKRLTDVRFNKIGKDRDGFHALRISDSEKYFVAWYSVSRWHGGEITVERNFATPTSYTA